MEENKKEEGVIKLPHIITIYYEDTRTSHTFEKATKTTTVFTNGVTKRDIINVPFNKITQEDVIRYINGKYPTLESTKPKIDKILALNLVLGLINLYYIFFGGTITW